MFDKEDWNPHSFAPSKPDNERHILDLFHQFRHAPDADQCESRILPRPLLDSNSSVIH